ncbi:MAG TPA: beta-phosphoglucomutase family hydrolase [Saprospiraceae bacterium]|nr:beta-phosphoglucomutase family hydrolase [Saprospiraceae bacterium]HND88740.1 beta-phosphoglucomutase family hydrolase [Saprospiraceae bacterium]
MIRLDHMVKGCIFNLDGVLVDTAPYHYIAWRRLANQWGFDISPEQHETLRGLSRMASLERVLEWGGSIYMTEAEKLHWGDVKNNWYVSLVRDMTPSEVLPGVHQFLTEVRARGCRMALSSASRSAREVLRKTDLERHFDAIIDGHLSRKPKPNPEGFMLATEALGLSPQDCLVFEDSALGTMAGVFAKFQVVGIGTADYLPQAHFVIPGFAAWSFEALLQAMHVQLGCLQEEGAQAAGVGVKDQEHV